MKLDRSIKPEDKIPSKFHLPGIHNFKLENGVDTYLVENKKLPIVKMSLVSPSGSRFDPYGNEGLAYLTALTVDEGAGNFDALQLADEIDKLGSSIELSSSADHIFINLTSLEENFENTLKLFASIINEPHFEKVSFERERKKQKTKIDQMFDDPGYIAANAFQKVIFKNTGYEKPIVGYSSSVEHIELSAVKNYFQKFFKSCEVKLLGVSSIETDRMNELLNKYLGNSAFDSSLNDDEYKFQSLEPKLYFINKEGAAQSEIICGHLVKQRNDQDFFAAKLANSILGGQFTSRINLNLREDKGYTYGAHSAISYNSRTGYFTLSASVQSDYTLDSIKEIRKEIKLIKDDIRDDEIEFAKSSLVKQFPSMFETYSQLIKRIKSLVLFDLPETYYDDYIQSIWDVTKGDILRAANDYIPTNRVCYFVVGDKEKIGDELFSVPELDFIELDKFGNFV